MTKSLDEIAKQLRDSGKKVNLIYAFNGTGKTRLSKALKSEFHPKAWCEDETTQRKILYSMHLPKIYSIGIMIYLMTLNQN